MTDIANVKAELFILHDRGDPFIPYTETRKLKDAIGGRDNVHFDELRLFEHVQPKLNQRPEIIALDTRVKEYQKKVDALKDLVAVHTTQRNVRLDGDNGTKDYQKRIEDAAQRFLVVNIRGTMKSHRAELPGLQIESFEDS